MTALDRLSQLLNFRPQAGLRAFETSNSLGAVIESLQKHNRSGSGAHVPEDLQQAAVRRFWDAQRFESLKDARLVSFGMCVPSRPAGPCIMEDRLRFLSVLDDQSGIGQWAHDPRWYRRCYQGLVRSYFTYDAKLEAAPAVGKRNWSDLRDYLSSRNQRILDSKVNPDWVLSATKNKQLFSDSPCEPYARDLLQGDSAHIDLLCEQLGIVGLLPVSKTLC